MKKVTIISIILIAILGLSLSIYAETDYLTANGKIVDILGIENIEEDNVTKEVEKVTVRITEGEYKTEEYEMNYTLSEDVLNDAAKNTELKQDDSVIVKLTETDGEIESLELQEVVKTNYYIYMLISFIILSILVGGKKGIKPILILLIIIATIYFVFINNIKNDMNMIITAFAAELIILVSTAIILNGFSKKMITNIISSVVSIGIAGILMSTLFNLMKISVEVVDYKTNLNQVIALGSMIACTELSLTIATIISAYLENEKRENPNIKLNQLIRKGLDKGMETYTNTIGIPIIMYSCGITTLVTLVTEEGINNDNIALALAYLFSILTGAILTIPITSLVYSLFNKNKIFYKTKSDNIIDGQRSLKL